MARRWTNQENETLRVLRYQLGLTWGEIGEIMNRDAGVCQSHAWTMKKKISERLLRAGASQLGRRGREEAKGNRLSRPFMLDEKEKAARSGATWSERPTDQPESQAGGKHCPAADECT